MMPPCRPRGRPGYLGQPPDQAPHRAEHQVQGLRVVVLRPAVGVRDPAVPGVAEHPAGQVRVERPQQHPARRPSASGARARRSARLLRSMASTRSRWPNQDRRIFRARCAARRSRAGPADRGLPGHRPAQVPVAGARAVHLDQPGQPRPVQFGAERHLGHGRAADVAQADQADPVRAGGTAGRRQDGPRGHHGRGHGLRRHSPEARSPEARSPEARERARQRAWLQDARRAEYLRTRGPALHHGPGPGPPGGAGRSTGPGVPRWADAVPFPVLLAGLGARGPVGPRPAARRRRR